MTPNQKLTLLVLFSNVLCAFAGYYVGYTSGVHDGRIDGYLHYRDLEN